MALINPGLGVRLADLLRTLREYESNAPDNGMQLARTKEAMSEAAEGLCAALWRAEEERSALDYDDEQRTAQENVLKRRMVYLAHGFLSLLESKPQRDWRGVAELEELVGRLTTNEDTAWQPELVKLGGEQGITVEHQRTSDGMALFDMPEGQVEAHIFKAREPDVVLNGVSVYLVQLLGAGGALLEKYTLMVDDEYWGMRIQPAAFSPPPFAETFVMGYRLRGQILHDDVPQADANVSIEVTLNTAEDGQTVLWDSEEYNELVYSDSLNTYVEGPTVLAPMRTGLDGWCEFISPRGHGAVYQRQGDTRDDTEETRAKPLMRYVAEIEFAYKGRKAVVTETQPAIINIASGRLSITGTPGAWVRVGPLDDAGGAYQMPPAGNLQLSGLVQGEYSIVQFKRMAWGAWDANWGCPRAITEVRMGETSSIALSPMEDYGGVGNQACGRVYERIGVPAAGIDVVIIDTESAELVGVAATTDGSGFWSVEIPPEGLGGDLFIHDQDWGSMPVLGLPYSDVVLGARACADWQEMFKPEAWRKGMLGHNNFQYVPGAMRVEDLEGNEVSATTEAPYGGWVSVETLPKYVYVDDVEELVINGPQLWHYRLVSGDQIVDPDFILRTQPFEDNETLPGQFRATAYQPGKKILVGSKIHGNIVMQAEDRIGVELPEAARVGLEFGRHKSYVEPRILGVGEKTWSAVGDWLCPYCGGPAERDPGAAVPRGHCKQCAVAFGCPDAMDCRSCFRSPTASGKTERRARLRVVVLDGRSARSRQVAYHWRPELYDETEFFQTQSGAGQKTNAPRWFAKHVAEVGDGKGFGQFDGDLVDPYVPGHLMSYFEALPFINRSLGLAQLKLAFPPGYMVPYQFTVDLDCVRGDETVETIRVTVGAGLQGPNEGDPFGDVVPVVQADKLLAEQRSWPYREVGLFIGIQGIRLVEPSAAPGCKFTVVGDVPFLQSADGVAMAECESTPVAIQVSSPWGQPHVFEDDVGQLFAFFVEDGDVWFTKRVGLPGEWEPPRRVTSDGCSLYPWADKDQSGRLVLVRQQGYEAVVAWSHNDGEYWQEV